MIEEDSVYLNKGSIRFAQYNGQGVLKDFIKVDRAGTLTTNSINSDYITVSDRYHIPVANICLEGKRALSSIVHPTVQGRYLLTLGTDFSSVVVEKDLIANEFVVASSSKVKKDITDVKDSVTLMTNIPVYTYKYNNSDKLRVGVMADEVPPQLSADGKKVDLPSMIALAMDALQKIAGQNKILVGV
jgi:hypothetical protein